jgi:DNA (cytosine-5)-methyltransferase 1
VGGGVRFGSLFAGIGGFDVGFERAGMQCAYQVEQDRHCQAVQRYHWPNVVRLDDVRAVTASSVAPVDLICGGFPCQDLSVAGRRRGLDGDRSGLFWEFARILGECRPGWVVIENVPGLLSSNDGRDMGTVLGTLAELGYWWAYRVLDAQYFGLAQRRKRVFIVGRLGGPGAEQVLFEPSSLSGHPAPSREAGEEATRTLTSGSGGGRYDRPANDGGAHADRRRALTPARSGTGRGTPLVAASLNAHGQRIDGESETFVSVAFQHNQDLNEHVDISPSVTSSHGGTPAIAFAQNSRSEVRLEGGDGQRTGASSTGGGKPGQGMPMVFTERTRAEGRTLETSEEVAYALTNPGSGGRTHSRSLYDGQGVRRLTPTECERLQGFPDDHTRYGVKPNGEQYELADSPRYRQLGNAVAVPVAEWIGRRLMAVLALGCSAGLTDAGKFGESNYQLSQQGAEGLEAP